MSLPGWFVDRIKQNEGYRSSAYRDGSQYSIGYGSRAKSPSETIDQNEANRRLLVELAEARRNVEGIVPKDAPENARLALTSLTHNAGTGWMKDGLGDLVRQGDWPAAAARLQLYVKSQGQTLKGLVTRRGAEADLMMGREQPGGAPVTTAGTPGGSTAATEGLPGFPATAAATPAQPSPGQVQAQASSQPPRPPADIPITGRSLAGVNPRLVAAVQGGAQYLPQGYTIQATSGKEGRRGGGYHPGGNAADFQIIGPDGKAIPNKGEDSTGMYTQLARGVKTWAMKNDPEIAGQIGWGGAFGTTSLRGNSNAGVPDLMHFDLGGSRGNMVPDRQFAKLQPLDGQQPTTQVASAAPAAPGATTTAAPGAAPANSPTDVSAAKKVAAPAARGSLGQEIIKAMGPRGAGVTTFVDPATGHEFLTGSSDGQDMYRDLGPVRRSAPAAAARAQAPSPSQPVDGGSKWPPTAQDETSTPTSPWSVRGLMPESFNDTQYGKAYEQFSKPGENTSPLSPLDPNVRSLMPSRYGDLFPGTTAPAAAPAAAPVADASTPPLTIAELGIGNQPPEWMPQSGGPLNSFALSDPRLHPKEWAVPENLAALTAPPQPRPKDTSRPPVPLISEERRNDIKQWVGLSPHGPEGRAAAAARPAPTLSPFESNISAMMPQQGPIPRAPENAGALTAQHEPPDLSWATQMPNAFSLPVPPPVPPQQPPQIAQQQPPQPQAPQPQQFALAEQQPEWWRLQQQGLGGLSPFAFGGNFGGGGGGFGGFSVGDPAGW